MKRTISSDELEESLRKVFEYGRRAIWIRAVADILAILLVAGTLYIMLK